MKKSKLAATVAFLVYVVIVFLIFYNIDKKMLAIFCADHPAYLLRNSLVSASLLKRFSDSK